MCINVAFERFTVRTSDCGQKSNQSIRDTLVVFSGLTELIRNACKMFQFLLKFLRVKNNIFRIFSPVRFFHLSVYLKIDINNFGKIPNSCKRKFTTFSRYFTNHSQLY